MKKICTENQYIYIPIESSWEKVSFLHLSLNNTKRKIGGYSLIIWQIRRRKSCRHEEAAGMRRKPKNRRGRQDRFFLCCETAGQAKEKLPLATVWNVQDEEAAGHRACPLFRAATVLQLPTHNPCWV